MIPANPSSAFEVMIRQGTIALGRAIDRALGHPAPPRLDPAQRQRQNFLAAMRQRRETRVASEFVTLPRIRALCAIAAEETGADLAEVLSHSRRRLAVRARQRVYRQLHAEGWNPSRIGRAFQRDHTTILHALRGGA